MHTSCFASVLLSTSLLLSAPGSAAGEPAHSEEWGSHPRGDVAEEASRVEQARWQWPVGGDRQVVRPFIAPTHRWSAGHRGVDLRSWDTGLLAPASGVVRFAGWVVDRPVLSIDHDGVISSYEPVVASVNEGEEVAAGELIGTVELGHCPARCVHLGVRIDGEYRNPLLWLGGVPRSVLLPTRSLD